MRIRFGGLWHHPDFMKFWSGQTISIFGSMIGGTAMSFTAILFLQATPFQLGVLHALEIAPAFAAGLFAGAWVDRLRRRPLMIWTDIGRALLLASIPLAALLGGLRIEQVYLVTLGASVLTIVFNLAYQSYLPTLVGKDHVVEGNSKLSASAAAAEFGGFSLAGWLVQLFTAPVAVLIDAFSFLGSALSLSLVRAAEPPIEPQEHPNMRREIVEGLRAVLSHPLLRASALAIAVQSLSGSLYGALVVLYMSRGLGFEPGVLGMIWAVGGVSSLAGAALAPRVTAWLGMGRSMVWCMALSGISAFFIPLAVGVNWVSAALLVAAQLFDGFFVIYEINQVSLRQRIIPERLLGRVNATMSFLGMGAALAGTLLGGALGEWVGVRPTLFLGGAGTLLATLLLALSPLSRERGVDEADQAKDA